MKNLTKYITFYFLTFFYLLSALEVNACGIQNTFFDEFDTYIESKEQGIEKIALEQDKKNNKTSSLTLTVSFNYFEHPTFLVQPKNLPSLYLQPYRLQNCKLTILHSVWRI